MAKKGKPKKKLQRKVKKKKEEDIEKIERGLEKAVEAETEEELRQKCKDLAAIIEEMSSAVEEVPSGKVENIIEPKLKELEQKFATQLEGLKESLESLEKKLGKPVKVKGELGDVLSGIEEKIETRLTSLEEQMKALDKISELEEKIKGITAEEGKEGKQIPKKLSILEERVIQTMQEDLIEVKEAVENLYNSFDTMRDRTEKKIQKIQEALTPETLKKLEELISFLDKAVPAKVKEEVGDKFNTIFDQLKDLRENTSALEKKMKKVLEEVNETQQRIKFIKEMKNDIAKLQLEKDKLYKTIDDLKLKSIQMDNDLEFRFKNQIDELIKKFDDFDTILNNHLKVTQERINKQLSEFSKTKLLEIEKRYYTIASSLQENVKSLQSYLTKFEETVNLSLNSIKDRMEKFNLRFENLQKKEKEEHQKFQKNMMAQIEEFVNDPENYPQIIEEKVETLFSSLVEPKFSEIEKNYSTGISSVEDSVNNLESKISKLEDGVNLSFSSLKEEIENLNSELEKFRKKDDEEHQSLNEKIMLEKDHFEDTLKTYPKIIEAKVNSLFSSMAESKLSEIEKKHHSILTNVKKEVKDLESKFFKFENTVNSTFNTVKVGMEDLNLQLEKFKEKEKGEHSKLVKKIVANKVHLDKTIDALSKDIEERLTKDISQLSGELEEKSKALEINLNQQISELTNTKIQDIESRYSEVVASIEERAKEMDSNLSKFKKTLTSNLNTIESKLENLNATLKKIRDKNKDNYLKLEGKISDNKYFLEHKLNEHSEFIENKVAKLFSDMTESKISEMEKKHSDILHWIEENVNKMGSDLSDFKEHVNSNLNSINKGIEGFNIEIKKLKQQLKKLSKETGTVKTTKESIKKDVYNEMLDELERRLSSIYSDVSILRERIDQQEAVLNSAREGFKKELDKKLAADRVKYEEMVKKIMSEKKSLEDLLKKRTEKINTLLKELRA